LIVGLALAAAAAFLLLRRRRRWASDGVGLAGVVAEPDRGRVALVANPGSGGAGGVGLDGVPVRELGEGEDLDEVLRDLADDGAAVLGVAGGDGSVGCAAQVASERGRILWVVPGGTLNHFARDLGMTDPQTALGGLRAGAVAAVDVADADGIAFVNNASLGVYGDLVRRREALESRLPKRLALLLAAAVVLRGAAPIEVEIDGARDRVFLVFVGNNPYSGTGLTGRESLQSGLLDVRILSAAGRLPRLATLWAILVARGGRSRWLAQSLRSRLDVRLLEPAVLAHDGEVRDVAGDVAFTIRRAGLRVIAPDPAP
jgi:undecaprenyl-diphosphatase